MANNNKIIIGIPAWNEEVNISFLLTDLLKQEVKSGVIEKIVVVSDGSSDSTVEKVLSLSSSLIDIIDHKDRKGQGARQNELLERSDYDCLVLINADMRIVDTDFIEKLCYPVLLGRADLTSCRLQEGKPKNFFEKILGFGNEFKRRVFESYFGGDNWHNCRGGSRAFSAKLGSRFRFGRSVSEDLYSYLYTKFYGYKFEYVTGISCYYALPTNIKDHIKQNKRYYGSSALFYEEFGYKYVTSIVSWPLMRMTHVMLKMLVESPIIGFFYCLLSLYCMIICRFYSDSSINNWGHVTSSKEVRL